MILTGLYKEQFRTDRVIQCQLISAGFLLKFPPVVTLDQQHMILTGPLQRTVWN